MTTIGEIGEDALIAIFAPHLPESDVARLGLGDDAAVIPLDGDLVVSSDVLIEDRHFRRHWSTGADVGWRAAMQNIADIDAMGAVPVALTVTLAAPADTEVDWVVDFADGLREACAPHGVGVVGGDLSSSPVIAISVTALGETHGTDPITRGDAHPGDVLAVSGDLGASAAGFAALTAGLEGAEVEEAVRLFRRPSPTVGEGLRAALVGASAMMDISDGLVRDASRIARASSVAVRLRSASIPLHPAAIRVAEALGVNPLRYGLTGGEDHHLLAAFPTESSVPLGWTVVGSCVHGAGITVDGQVPEDLGWDHFEH